MESIKNKQTKQIDYHHAYWQKAEYKDFLDMIPKAQS